jgi:hypothetical protein
MIEEKNNDEISIRDIFFGIRIFFRFVFTYWIAILLAGIIGGAFGYFISKLVKPKYTANLTFVLSSESKTGSLSNLASQFGLDFGSGSGNDVFSGENIITLFKSKKMIRSVLFKTPPGSKESLINIFVKELGVSERWGKNERTKNLVPFPKDVEQLTPIQDSLFRELYNTIVENFLTVSRPDKKLSVYELTTTSTNPIFACYLTKYLMDQTAQFYIETKTSLSKINLAMLQKEADSLRALLGGAISSTASEGERTFNLNPALQSERAPAQKSQVRATVLATAYGEVVKNLEIAKVTLQRERPLYQIIDEPELPLKAKRLSGLLCALAGAIIFGLIMMIAIYIKNKI